MIQLHFSRNIQRFVLPAVALLTLGGMTVLSAGCGGGGGGGTTQRATLSSTRTATIGVVQQSRGLPALIAVFGSGSADLSASGRGAGKRTPLAGASARLLSGAGKATRQVSDLEYSSDLDLYVRTTEGATSYRADFYEDPEGTQSAGSATATLTGLNSARVDANITGGNIPLRGTLNLTRAGDTGIRTVGTVRQTRTNESIALDLTTDADTTATTGTVSVTDSNGTVHYRNLESSPDGGFVADLEYRTATGDVTQSGDGSGRVRLAVSAGHGYEAVYDGDGSGALTLFDAGSDVEQQTEIIDDFDTL